MRTLETILRDEVNPHLNELVLDGGFNVVKLLGAIEDKEDPNPDYYYLFQYPGSYKPDSNNGQVLWHSCVGTFYPLKGRLPDNEYNRLVELWEINEPYWTPKP
jgi:hypothetical protein